MIKYQFFKGSPTEAILLKDSGQSACPNVPPMKYPHPTIAGQTIMGRVPCTSLCPLAEFDEDGEDGATWTVNCGATPRTFDVTEFVVEAKSPFSIV